MTRLFSPVEIQLTIEILRIETSQERFFLTYRITNADSRTCTSGSLVTLANDSFHENKCEIPSLNSKDYIDVQIGLKRGEGGECFPETIECRIQAEITSNGKAYKISRPEVLIDKADNDQEGTNNDINPNEATTTTTNNSIMDVDNTDNDQEGTNNDIIPNEQPTTITNNSIMDADNTDNDQEGTDDDIIPNEQPTTITSNSITNVNNNFESIIANFRNWIGPLLNRITNQNLLNFTRNRSFFSLGLFLVVVLFSIIFSHFDISDKVKEFFDNDTWKPLPDVLLKDSSTDSKHFDLIANVTLTEENLIRSLSDAFGVLPNPANANDMNGDRIEHVEQGKLSQMLTNMNKDSLIAVFGAMKAGKSTLLSSFFGVEVLPSQTLPMTTIPIRVAHKSNATEKILTIPEVDKWNEKIAWYKEELEYNRYIFIRDDKDDRELYKIQEKIRNSNLSFESMYKGEKKISQILTELSMFVRLLWRNDITIEEVGIGMTFENLPLIELSIEIFKDLGDKGLVFLDTPGPNESNAGSELKTLTAKIMSQAIGCFFVLNKDDLEATHMKKFYSMIHMYMKKKPVELIVNKWDAATANKEESAPQLVEVIKGHFNDDIVNNSRIVFTSGYYLLQSQKLYNLLQNPESLESNIKADQDIMRLLDKHNLNYNNIGFKNRKEIKNWVMAILEEYSYRQTLGEIKALYETADLMKMESNVKQLNLSMQQLNQDFQTLENWMDMEGAQKEEEIRKLQENSAELQNLVVNMDEAVDELYFQISEIVNKTTEEGPLTWANEQNHWKVEVASAGEPDTWTDDNYMHQILKLKGASTGDLRCSLKWENEDDLDLHCVTPDSKRISYQKKEHSIGKLDVDMNAGGIHGENFSSTDPVENIVFNETQSGLLLQHGIYSFEVQNFHSIKKDPGDDQVTVECYYNGKTIRKQLKHSDIPIRGLLSRGNIGGFGSGETLQVFEVVHDMEIKEVKNAWRESTEVIFYGGRHAVKTLLDQEVKPRFTNLIQDKFTSALDDAKEEITLKIEGLWHQFVEPISDLAPDEHMNLTLPSYELNGTALVDISLSEANIGVNNVRLATGPVFVNAMGKEEVSSVLNQKEFREDILAFFRRATEEVHSRLLQDVMELYLKGPILQNIHDQKIKALQKVEHNLALLEELKAGTFSRESFVKVKNQIELRRPLLEAQYSDLVTTIASANAEYVNAKNRMTPLKSKFGFYQSKEETCNM